MKAAIACLTLLASLPAALAAAASADTLRVRDGNRVAVLQLDEYVAGVVAGETGKFRSEEALKAMAVAARTYAVRMRGRHSAEGYDLCGTTHCQVLNLRAVNARIREIVASTTGEMLWYEGRPALAFYSQDCGGRTEDGAVLGFPEIPYLRPHTDSYCRRNNPISWQWVGDGSGISRALQRSGWSAPARVERIQAAGQTSGGRVAAVMVSGGGHSVRVNAAAFRLAVSREFGWNTIRSDRWTVDGKDGRFLFQGTGSGHGAGLCQFGAEQMGLEGHTYREILAAYYQGVREGVLARDLQWTRIGGERVTLMTMRPSADSALLSAAERISRELGVAAGVEVRIYPDTASFRDATGEPGWIAGFTSGRRIHLQARDRPSLEATLRHEMRHVWVEDRAAPGVPLWFREGLVGFLERRDGGGAAGDAPADAALRDSRDAARVRQAYADARARVETLMRQHGEAVVMDWLRTGLPGK